jgi:hypothetical protein
VDAATIFPFSSISRGSRLKNSFLHLRELRALRGEKGQQHSGGNLFEGKTRDVGALAGVFDGDAQDAATFVHIEQRVLIQVARLGDGIGFELDVQRVGVLKVSYSHNLKDRSKNALCTVSPSGNSTGQKLAHLPKLYPHSMKMTSDPYKKPFRVVGVFRGLTNQPKAGFNRQIR